MDAKAELDRGAVRDTGCGEHVVRVVSSHWLCPVCRDVLQTISKHLGYVIWTCDHRFFFIYCVRKEQTKVKFNLERVNPITGLKAGLKHDSPDAKWGK